jgi:hypothetical protein
MAKKKSHLEEELSELQNNAVKSVEAGVDGMIAKWVEQLNYRIRSHYGKILNPPPSPQQKMRKAIADQNSFDAACAFNECIGGPLLTNRQHCFEYLFDDYFGNRKGVDLNELAQDIGTSVATITKYVTLCSSRGSEFGMSVHSHDGRWFLEINEMPS